MFFCNYRDVIYVNVCHNSVKSRYGKPKNTNHYRFNPDGSTKGFGKDGQEYRTVEYVSNYYWFCATNYRADSAVAGHEIILTSATVAFAGENELYKPMIKEITAIVVVIYQRQFSRLRR